MKPMIPSQDVVPLSELRANLADLLKQTQQTGRPIVITQHGRGVAVLVSTDEYEKLLADVEIAKGISRGLADVAAGRTHTHEKVMAELEGIIDEARRTQGGKRRKSNRKGAA